VQRAGLACEITHVRDVAKFASYGVMMPPALVVDGRVVVAGKIPSEEELANLLATAPK